MSGAQQSYLTRSQSVVIYKDNNSYYSSNALPKEKGSVRPASSNSNQDFNYVKWFDDSNNLEPLDLLKVLINNPIGPTILTTKAKFVVGKSIQTYKELIVEGKKKIELVEIEEIKEFFRKNKIHEQLFLLEKDLQYFGNAWILYKTGITKNKIISIRHRDATKMRTGAVGADQKVHSQYLSSDWKSPKYEPDSDNNNVLKFPAWDDEDADGSEQEQLATKVKLDTQFMYHIKDYTPGFPYYSLPEWYGLMKWLELANTIPSWHLQGIKNGYTVRYLIEVNDSIFNGISPEELPTARQKLQEELDNCLAGSENMGKTMFVGMSRQDFIDKGLIRITPISLDLHDEAFAILFEHSNTAATSGFAIDPTLCGIETQGKLSSGSEKREAYELWLKVHAERPRQILLKALDPIIFYNGWDQKYPDVKFGFENIQLTTIDVNPTGSQNVIS